MLPILASMNRPSRGGKLGLLQCQSIAGIVSEECRQGMLDKDKQLMVVARVGDGA